MKIANLIDPFRPADGPPPGRFIAFVRWTLKGAWPVLWLAAFVSVLAGLSETGTAWVLGKVIDGVVESGRENFFSARNLGLFALALGFFMGTSQHRAPIPALRLHLQCFFPAGLGPYQPPAYPCSGTPLTKPHLAVL